MKNTFLTFSACILFIAANAQTDLMFADRHNLWDTVNNVWQGHDSVLYYYDIQNRVSTEVHLAYATGTAHWDTVTKQSYTYHPTLGLLSIKNYYNYNSGGWVSSFRETYQYDIDSSLFYKIFYTYTGGAFVPSYRDEYYYNSYKNKTSYYHKIWNTGTSAYDNSTKTVYTYNVLQQNDTILNLSWAGSLWTNVKYEAYTYNVQGLLNTRTQFTWNAGIWNYGFRWSYSYNAGLKVLQEFFYTYNSGIWTNFYKVDYTYLSNIYLSQTYRYNWNNSATSWDIAQRTDYQLNSDNNLIDRKVFELSSITHLMEITQHYIYNYDADKNLSYQAYAARVNYLGTERYNYENFYWYLLSPNVINDIAPEVKLSIFPIPATNILSVQFVLDKTAFVHITLYNANGSLIKNVVSREESSGQVLVTTDVSNLPAGIYFLQTSIDSKSTTQQIVISH